MGNYTGSKALRKVDTSGRAQARVGTRELDQLVGQSSTTNSMISADIPSINRNQGVESTHITVGLIRSNSQ